MLAFLSWIHDWEDLGAGWEMANDQTGVKTGGEIKDEYVKKNLNCCATSKVNAFLYIYEYCIKIS